VFQKEKNRRFSVCRWGAEKVAGGGWGKNLAMG
jgi:hypothetical protein